MSAFLAYFLCEFFFYFSILLCPITYYPLDSFTTRERDMVKSAKHIKNKWQQKELEKKRIKKITTLRKYAKLCKREGLESDRVNINKKNDNADETEDHKPEKKIHKPFKPKKVEIPQQSPAEIQRQQREEQVKENIKKMEESLKRRKEQRKILTKKTAKGQPVLGGQIKNILGKLMKERS
jgi:hypothetical protein